MKIVIPGGRGLVGGILGEFFRTRGDEVVGLSRTPGPNTVLWDGRTLGPWAKEIDGADVVINLAGRSVNCRYNKRNLAEMISSRVDSTRVVGEAIAQAARPPRVWLQMSTATIYAHTYGPANDEATGIIGGAERDVPRYWDFSISIARAWEQELANAHTPSTRKIVLRSAMVMSPRRGGAFAILRAITRLGLGGSLAGGRQFMSWIHERDLARAVEFLIEKPDLEGVFNLAAPEPLPQRDFQRELRAATGIPIGLPAWSWMLEVAAFVHRTDTELLLKSRRVVPRRLLDSGFAFQFPRWHDAARELVQH